MYRIGHLINSRPCQSPYTCFGQVQLQIPRPSLIMVGACLDIEREVNVVVLVGIYWIVLSEIRFLSMCTHGVVYCVQCGILLNSTKWN